MYKGNKGKAGANGAKKSAPLVISNNFSLLDPDNEEIQESREIRNSSVAANAEEENSAAAAAASASVENSGAQATSDYKSLKLKNLYIHNQSWKKIA